MRLGCSLCRARFPLSKRFSHLVVVTSDPGLSVLLFHLNSPVVLQLSLSGAAHFRSGVLVFFLVSQDGRQVLFAFCTRLPRFAATEHTTPPYQASSPTRTAPIHVIHVGKPPWIPNTQIRSFDR